MNTRIAKLTLLPMATLLAACSFDAPRTVIVNDVKIDLLVLVGYLLVLGIVLFFMFVWPPRSSDR
ncbi:MAG: hypothetical protein R2911_41265 [Caldilineaceae bacterium]